MNDPMAAMFITQPQLPPLEVCKRYDKIARAFLVSFVKVEIRANLRKHLNRTKNMRGAHMPHHCRKKTTRHRKLRATVEDLRHATSHIESEADPGARRVLLNFP